MARRKVEAPGPSVVYGERLESLLGAVWPAAVGGDLRAVEVARRVLAQQAKFLGLDEVGAGPTPPIADNELVAEDELAVFRKRYRS